MWHLFNFCQAPVIRLCTPKRVVLTRFELSKMSMFLSFTSHVAVVFCPKSGTMSDNRRRHGTKCEQMLSATEKRTSLRYVYPAHCDYAIRTVLKTRSSATAEKQRVSNAIRCSPIIIKVTSVFLSVFRWIRVSYRDLCFTWLMFYCLLKMIFSLT